MFEVKNNVKAKAWGAPVFPAAGRLPTDIRVVSTNYEKQTTEENCFRKQVNARGQKQHSECCHSLHISLFFDGACSILENDYPVIRLHGKDVRPGALSHAVCN